MRVKICGITRVEDALVAERSGADAIGLVFYPKSSRYLSDLSLAREIALSVGPFVTVVGLFVDARSDFIANILANVPIHQIQFHGNESEQDCKQYQRPYMKALRMSENLDVLARINAYPSACGILLDTYVKDMPGGTGKSFDWQRVPHDTQKAIVLAGGLDADNVQQAIDFAKPYGVDISGGVEQAPGIKDANKVSAFVARAKTGVLKGE